MATKKKHKYKLTLCFYFNITYPFKLDNCYKIYNYLLLRINTKKS